MTPLHEDMLLAGHGTREDLEDGNHPNQEEEVAVEDDDEAMDTYHLLKRDQPAMDRPYSNDGLCENPSEPKSDIIGVVLRSMLQY